MNNGTSTIVHRHHDGLPVELPPLKVVWLAPHPSGRGCMVGLRPPGAPKGCSISVDVAESVADMRRMVPGGSSVKVDLKRTKSARS